MDLESLDVVVGVERAVRHTQQPDHVASEALRLGGAELLCPHDAVLGLFDARTVRTVAARIVVVLRPPLGSP